MSNQQSSYQSFSSSSYIVSSSSSDGQSHTKSYSERANYNSRDGGTIERESHETGQPSIVETKQFPVQGGQLSGGTDQARRIEDVTDADKEQERRDQEYLDRMEDEYAKREGGA